MTKYLSLKAFETALQAIDSSVEVREIFSEAALLTNMITPPVGKTLARIDGGNNRLLAIFNTSGAAGIANTLFAGYKGGHYAIQAGTYTAPVLATPVTVLLHSSVKALQDFLISKQAGNSVDVYFDEASINVTGAYRIIAQPGRYVVLKGTIPPSLLFVRDYGNQYLTVFK